MIIKILYNTNQITFEADHKIIFRGERVVEKKRYKWTLFDDKSNTVAVIKLKPYIFSFSFKEEFLVDYQGHSIVILYNAWKAPSYKLKMCDGDEYIAIVHRGNKLSLFRNNQQIGTLKETNITTGFKTAFQLILDDDIDLPIITTLIYVCVCTTETNDANMNFNLGNIGPELQEFNNEWKPK